MSTTALVRSQSTPSGLTRTASSNSSLVPSPSQQLKPSPASTVALPNTSQNQIRTPQSQTQYSTPATKTPTQQPSPAQSTPGRWQHPRMEEIIQRQNRTNFDSTNMQAILWNIAFLFLSFFAPSTLRSWCVTLTTRFAPLSHFDCRLPHTLLQSLAPYPTYTLLLIQLFSLFNITMASLPLLRTPDTCEDIPLTPAQRQLFGLPPASRPATPQEKEQWITPPRYSRSASNTPRSSPSSLRAEISGSPVPSMSTPFGSGSRRHSGSPLTEERRRLSLNRGNSPLSISEFDAAGSVNTPSKVNLNRASVGLNSKWLYEKGRASPTGSRLSGSGWGTGSVFT